ncbi:hypothetical protein D6C83_06038 [Aureobasidium pullulans]|uniref:Apple domain-containing protein n=1 Tax=Aureobasidium pullulans TaxID=5580 RepID=A0A4T0CAF3_AURPU|nr:hypothetical protein D6C83_06038 [Aureobasidium pullulans]
MRLTCFSISVVWLLLTSSSATHTKRQALIDSIGDSTLDDIVSQIRNDGNLTLLGDLLEVAVDALTTEATAVAECYNPSVPFPAEFDGSGSKSGQQGAETGPGGSGSSLPSTTRVVSQLSSLLGAVASAATSVPDTTKGDTTPGQAAAAAASSALDFLSSASSAASVAPGISSLLMSIVDNTAALPSTAVASLVDAAMNAPSFVSTNVPTTRTIISFPLYYSLSTTTPAYGVNGEGYGGSKASGILYSTPNSIHTSTPIASTTFKASSLQLSADDNLATSVPTAAFNSPTSLALSHSSDKAESTNVVNSGDGNGIGDGQNVSGGSNEGSTDGTSSPALSSIHVTVVGGSPSSSAIAPWVSTTAYAGSSSSATRSSDLAGATETFRDGSTSSVLHAASSASNSAEILPSPTPSPPSQNACPFISTSVFTVSGSRFTRYCNRFYGGKVLELDGRVLKRQATNSLDSCIDTCAPESRCVGTSYESTSGFCTFYSSLVDGITRNGIQFAVRLDTASSVLDPNDAPASTTETSRYFRSLQLTQREEVIKPISQYISASTPALSPRASRATDSTNMTKKQQREQALEAQLQINGVDDCQVFMAQIQTGGAEEFKETTHLKIVINSTEFGDWEDDVWCMFLRDFERLSHNVKHLTITIKGNTLFTRYNYVKPDVTTSMWVPPANNGQDADLDNDVGQGPSNGTAKKPKFTRTTANSRATAALLDSLNAPAPDPSSEGKYVVKRVSADKVAVIVSEKAIVKTLIEVFRGRSLPYITIQGPIEISLRRYLIGRINPEYLHSPVLLIEAGYDDADGIRAMQVALWESSLPDPHRIGGGTQDAEDFREWHKGEEDSINYHGLGEWLVPSGKGGRSFWGWRVTNAKVFRGPVNGWLGRND